MQSTNPWSRGRSKRGWCNAERLLVLALMVAACAMLLLSSSPIISSAAAPASGREEKRLSVYSRQARYGLTVFDREGQDYIDAVNLLEPLGSVEVQYGRTIKLRLGPVEGKFKEGKSDAKIGGRDIPLTGKTLLESGRILLPLRAAPGLLQLYTGLHSDLHYAALRLFVSDSVTRYSAHLYTTGPGGVRLDFTNPVNPTVSTEGDKLKLSFTREPVLPGTENVGFSDKVITSLGFSENNGNSEIVVNGVTPLIARFGDAGRSITIVPAPGKTEVAAAAQSPPPPPAPASTPPAKPEEPKPSTVALPKAPPAQQGQRSTVVIDASHGGDERGTGLTSDIAEKDVTLEVARRLRNELQKRNVRATLLRDGDVRMSLDQRAATANAIHPLLYVVIHAGGPGKGVRLYTTLFNGGGGYGNFVPWEWAQADFADRSRLMAASMLQELKKIQVPVLQLSVPVRPLNNVAAPAVAVEIAPSDAATETVSTAGYQQQIAAALAGAIVNSRGDLKDKQP